MMYLVVLRKDDREYSFASDGKIMLLEDINMPQQFSSGSEASDYLSGYMDAVTTHQIEFNYEFEIREAIKKKPEEGVNQKEEK